MPAGWFLSLILAEEYPWTAPAWFLSLLEADPDLVSCPGGGRIAASWISAAWLCVGWLVWLCDGWLLGGVLVGLGCGSHFHFGKTEWTDGEMPGSTCIYSQSSRMFQKWSTLKSRSNLLLKTSLLLKNHVSATQFATKTRKNVMLPEQGCVCYLLE